MVILGLLGTVVGLAVRGGMRRNGKGVGSGKGSGKVTIRVVILYLLEATRRFRKVPSRDEAKIDCPSSFSESPVLYAIPGASVGACTSPSGA